VLIAETEEAVSEARMRLARIGLEDARGYLKGGVEAWKQAGFPLATLPQISVEALSSRLQESGMQVLDVRREPEWEAGHIAGASWWPLDNFKVAPPELDHNTPIAVHCKGGYRSIIACSLLQRAGFQNVVNVVGGFDAWQQVKLPVVIEKPVEA
jgi:rhodanese-related sulfurtransferase